MVPMSRAPIGRICTKSRAAEKELDLRLFSPLRKRFRSCGGAGGPRTPRCFLTDNGRSLLVLFSVSSGWGGRQPEPNQADGRAPAGGPGAGRGPGAGSWGTARPGPGPPQRGGRAKRGGRGCRGAEAEALAQPTAVLISGDDRKTDDEGFRAHGKYLSTGVGKTHAFHRGQQIDWKREVCRIPPSE